jgi:hypothetical protein
MSFLVVGLKISVINKLLYEKIANKIVSIFHNRENDFMRWEIISSFQSVSDQYGSGVIHVDHDSIFAAVLYLSPYAPLNSGTSLFKPNRSFDEDRYESFLRENDKRFI